MDLNNLKLFKHLYQQIYDIIIANKEQYTQTYHQILINYSTLSEKSKTEISALFTTNTDKTTNDNNCSIDNSNINTTININYDRSNCGIRILT